MFDKRIGQKYIAGWLSFLMVFSAVAGDFTAVSIAEAQSYEPELMAPNAAGDVVRIEHVESFIKKAGDQDKVAIQFVKITTGFDPSVHVQVVSSSPACVKVEHISTEANGDNFILTVPAAAASCTAVIKGSANGASRARTFTVTASNNNHNQENQNQNNHHQENQNNNNHNQDNQNLNNHNQDNQNNQNHNNHNQDNQNKNNENKDNQNKDNQNKTPDHSGDQAGKTWWTPTTLPPLPTGHPRLLLTAKEVPLLRSWAVDSNPAYAKGLKPAIADSVKFYTQESYKKDNGSPTLAWYPTELHVGRLAFAANIDPDFNKRVQYSAMSKKMFLWLVDQANTPGTMFNQTAWPKNDRGRHTGENLAYALDWNYDAYSAAEKAKIRTLFLRWQDEIAPIYLPGTHPKYVFNDPLLINDPGILASADNNYRNNWQKFVTLTALAFDPVDDQPSFLASDANATVAPEAQVGRTLRSYINQELYAYLYQDKALMEGYANSPSIPMRQPMNGLPLEGGLYSYGLESGMGRTLTYTILAGLGITDPKIYGDNVTVVPYTHPYWKGMINAFMATISPEARPLGNMGNAYQILNYGQIGRVWPVSDFVTLYGPLAIQARWKKDAKTLNDLKWIMRDALEGGAPDFERRLPFNAILNFMIFDPNDKTPITKPATPSAYVSEPQGFVSARTSNAADASWFASVCSYAKVSHQMPYAGMIQYFRKGLWLTSNRQGYFQKMGDAPTYHNIMSIQNTPDILANDPNYSVPLTEAQASKVLNYGYDKYAFERGGQMMFNDGDQVSKISTNLPGIISTYCEATNLYNRSSFNGYRDGSNGAHDITNASRSVVWIKPDRIVIYDRATTKSANRFKGFNLNLIDKPTDISGRVVTSTMPDKQKLFVTSLLPASVNITAQPNEPDFLQGGPDPNAPKDPNDKNSTTNGHHLYIEDTTKAKDTRFLTVLQGADAGTSVDKMTTFQSNSGAKYQGVIVAGSAVLFSINNFIEMDTMTYTVPSQVKTSYLTGLEPNTGYTITIQTSGGNRVITVKKGGSKIADVAGVMVLDNATGK